MALTIRLLIVEDSEADAELAVRELKKAGLRITHTVVDTEAAFRQGLRAFGPDIILSDFSMPAFDGMEALRLARELTPEIPFVFFSGTLGEDYAIRALKDGASDYVVKGNLVRLPAAIERALAEAEAERQRRRLQTELEVAQDRLQLSEAGLRRAHAMARLAHLITGPGGVFESWSETLPELIGEDPANTGRSVRSWLRRMEPVDREAFRKTVSDAARTGQRAEIEFRLERDGKRVYLRQVIEPLADERSAQGAERWFSTLQDVTEQKAAEERIRRLNRVYAVLSGINGLIVRARSREELFTQACRIAVEAGQLRMAWLGVFQAGDQTVTPAACYGHEAGFLSLMSLSLSDPGPEGRGLVRRALREKRAVIINDMERDTKFRLREEALRRGFHSGAVLPLVVGDEIVGVLGLFAAEAHFFDDEEMRLLSELAGDIAFAIEHIDKSAKLDYLAYFDSLTGLANRALFLQRLEQALVTTLAAGQRLAVFVLDVDRFKSINDAIGRQAGDTLLKELAARMIEGHTDTALARLGADHFAVFRLNVESEEQIARLVERRLGELFGKPYALGESELRVSAKIGIALAPEDGERADTLLQKAEAALKRAKKRGEPYVFHAPAMSERTAENLALENRLRRALELNEFVLHYQPKVEIATRRIVGVEALIRWQSPELGLVPPMRFIPLLEETGLILEVGSWALKQAVSDHRKWSANGLAIPRVAVNVSALQLRQRNFVATLEQALHEGAQPVGLDLEITETLVMQDVEATTAKLKSARELGVQIAIDDFGTGYSSLAYLARLPVHTLKIDRAFIRDIPASADASTLVATMIGLAHSLRLDVVAEGVETEEQAKALLSLRCDQMQGFLFSKPVPSENLQQFGRQHQSH
jgi:diguanylate cyclase (GGDEF)-like protein